METTVSILETIEGHQEVAAHLAEYGRFSKGAFSESTERAVKADTAVFAGWCSERGLRSLPAEPATISAFVDDMATSRAPATVRRYLSSLAHMHRAAKLEDVTKAEEVKLALRRLGRTTSSRQDQAKALDAAALDRIAATTGDSLIDKRDIALLMVSRDMLARRSEVVALQVSSITFADNGTATVLIARSKTDPNGDGATLWLSPATTSALRSWLDAAGITEGAVFRSVDRGDHVGDVLDAGTVARVFKKLAGRAGFDASAISGHSARVGMACDLVAAGAELGQVMQAGRWKSPTMVARYAEKITAGNGAVAQFYGKRK